MKGKKIKKYDMGYFVNPNNYSSISSGLGMAAGLTHIGDNPNGVNRGSTIAGDALSGAAAGYQSFGLIGGAVGALGGAAYGVFSANNKEKQLQYQNRVNNANSLSKVDSSLNKVNVNPFGNQMYEYGDTVQQAPHDVSDNLKSEWNNFVGFLKTKKVAGSKNLDARDKNLGKQYIDEYLKSNPNSTLRYDSIPNIQQSLNNYRNNQWKNVQNKKIQYDGTYDNFMPSLSPTDGWLGSKTSQALFPQEIKNGKVVGFANTNYEDGGDIEQYKNGGSIHIKPENKGKFTAYKKRTGKTTEEALHSKDPHVRKMAQFAKNAKKWKHENGDMVQDNTPTNSQGNMINIQKGELLIDPTSGKILQEYNGINPLTGGLFEPHAKKESKESPNNFTLADPGLFVITKKTAKQYKDAVDNNDPISKKTILMNIRNSKQQKEGQTNYANGSDVGNPYIPITPYDQYARMLGIPTNPLPNTVPAGTTPMYAPAKAPVSANIVPNATPIVAKQSGFNPNSIVDGLAKYGPAAYNLGQGLFGHVETQPYATPITNPYKNQIEANMPQNIDFNPIINDIYANQDVANKDILNNASNSSIYRANRQQLNSNTNRAVTNARLQGQEANNQIRGTRAGIYEQLGAQDMNEQAQRRQYNLGIDDINNRRQAAKQNLLNAGLSQLQSIQMNDKTNKQKAGLDKYSINLLKQIFPNLKYYDQFDYDTVNSQIR